MTHQFRDKKQIEKKKKIIRNIIGFGLFFILVAVGILSWTGKLFNFAGRPIWEAERIVNKGLNNSNYLLRSKQSLSNENKKLIEENSNLKISMLDYEILKNENNELKEILGRISTLNNYILGNILTKPNHSPYDTIIIDIGESSGIKEGDLIYAEGIIPVGIVSKVYGKTSLVSLYTNPGVKTEGFINDSNASVGLIGRGGGNFEMIIPLELIVDKGTLIYLPGSSVEIIAIVDDVISTPSDPFKKVLLSSPVNVQNLKWVQVKKD
jgi:rod shape-determining protein MreC